MLYVKIPLSQDAAIRAEITDENVFTLCPVCGNEHNVDIMEFAEMEDFDLYGSTIYCEDCSGKPEHG